MHTRTSNPQTIDRFIEEVVSSCQIPSARRRKEVFRELNAHVDDFILRSRGAGHTEEETQRLVLASFGDPREIAAQFAWVYRKERAILHILVFLLSTVTVASSVAAVVMLMRAGIAIGLGVPLVQMFSIHHTTIQVMDIFSTVAVYLGLTSFEKFFKQRSLPKATALLAAVSAILIGMLTMAGAHWQFLLFGLVSGVFLRTIQEVLKHEGARVGVVITCFGLIGLLSFRPVTVASWLVTGLGYQAMTHLAGRVDRALFNGIQQF
jgi:hypothetical protein